MTHSPTTSILSPARLAALRATGLLDAPPEQAFDRLTGLAVRLIGVPVALVSLVDRDRQFFVSCPGLGEPWASARETPHSHSFCQHVVASGAPLVIEDSREHPLLAHNLGVRDLGVIAYAGLPLITSRGHVLGSFCAIDTRPRRWSESDLATLADLAAAAVTEVELRIVTRTLAERESQHAALLDHASELICAADLAGGITYVNRAWQDTLGYTADEARDIRPAALVTPEHRGRFIDVAVRLQRGEPVVDFEAVLIAKDGRRIVCRGRGSAHVADGVVVGTYAVYRDMTEERRSEHVRTRLVATLEASPDFVMILTSTGKLVFLNRAARRLVDLAEDAEVSSVDPAMLRPPAEHRRMADEIIPLAVHDGVWQGESTLLDAGGERVPVSQVVVSHPSTHPGEPPFFVSVVAHDLRHRVKAEHARRHSEALFRAAVDASLDAFLLFRSVRSADGRITDFEIVDANEQACALVTRPREALVGALLCETFPEHRTRGLFDEYVRVVETGDVLEREFETTVAGVTASWVQIQAVKVGDGCGVTTRDISERRTDEATRERDRAFQTAVLEHLSDGIVACDAAGQLTLFNRATREFHGLPPEPIPAERWAEHYALYQADGTTPLTLHDVPLFRALRGERVVNEEMVIAPLDHPPRAVICSGQQFFDAEGQLLGAVVAMRDVTAQKITERALRDSEERFRTVVQSLGEGVIITDLRGVAIYSNDRMRDITGYSADELIGRDLTQLLFKPEERDTHERHLDVRRRGDGERYTVEHLRKDGRLVWVEIAGVPFRNGAGEVIGTVGSVTDVSERRRWEAELLEAKEEAERANRAKSDFLSRASHELRTPLNSVIGFSGILLKNRAGTLAASDLSYVERIRANGGHLLSLVDDLLDIAKVEAGRMTLELSEVVLFDLVHDVVATLEGRVIEKGITLVADVPFALRPALTDAAKLKQVLINLVGNAIKFTSEGGVTVRVLGSASGAPESIVVQDTGCGIPTADLERIFDAFTQADAARHAAESGTGLGLAISRSFCDLLGYRLRAESELGAGTRFIIDF